MQFLPPAEIEDEDAEVRLYILAEGCHLRND